MVGSAELAGFTQVDEQEAIINCERSDANNGDYNVLSGGNDVYNIINRTTSRRY